jgi:hypothetical protein
MSSKQKRMIKDGLRLTPELPLEHGEKRLCANCGENEVYLVFGRWTGASRASRN